MNMSQKKKSIIITDVDTRNSSLLPLICMNEAFRKSYNMLIPFVILGTQRYSRQGSTEIKSEAAKTKCYFLNIIYIQFKIISEWLQYRKFIQQNHKSFM
jgi:hypothetical protein